MENDRTLARGKVRRKNEGRLTCAMSIARTGFWEWDLKKSEIYRSDEMRNILGLAPHEAATTFDSALATIHADDRQRVQQFVAAALGESTDRAHGIDFRIVCADGEARHVHARGKVISRDQKGLPVFAVGTLTDITERKKSEETLRRQELALYQRQATKMEVVGQLAGGIAHEFNNLLQAIEGYTRFAMQGLDPHDGRYQDLQEVMKASQGRRCSRDSFSGSATGGPCSERTSIPINWSATR